MIPKVPCNDDGFFDLLMMGGIRLVSLIPRGFQGRVKMVSLLTLSPSCGQEGCM